MLMIESRMVIIFWACNPIYFRNVSLWYPFLEPHFTVYNSNNRCMIKVSNQIRHVYLAYVETYGSLPFLLILASLLKTNPSPMYLRYHMSINMNECHGLSSLHHLLNISSSIMPSSFSNGGEHREGDDLTTSTMCSYIYDYHFIHFTTHFL